MNKFTELVKKIREIFQIDRADLDFGIYRILNARSEEINQFLDKELQKRVKEALAGDNSEKLRQKKEELKAKEDHYRQDGVDPDSVPKIKELRQEIAGYMSENVDYENEVYSHLLRFFSRYYDKGDFISRRRYKADTYAVPYSGEEVVLHWANKDQYYIKSGEYFSNYSFNLDDGRRVTFKLVSADTAKDNRKDAEQNRLFVLAEPHIRVREDDDGDEYEEKIETIVESSDELVINFIYAPQPKGTKQGSLVKEALEVLLNKPEISKNWSALLERRPIDSNPLRTLLEKQLTDYTEKNNADYFIHKDLGGFLRRELDFYIKSEVMNLDDIQHINTFKGIEKNLKMIQCLRLIAGHLIDFMAQLENFQKKLWLKKKFVVETNYCITLDRIPEEFYDEICKNEAQLEEWVKLFAIDEIEKDSNRPGFSRPLKKAFLKANDKLVLDTKFFSKSFKYRLLSSIDNLDDQCEGLLIHSENFQALQFLQSSYKDSINCIYIDPPYNTDASKIIYKNGYEHSSWLSLMLSRLELSKRLMSGKGIIEVAIDDYELRYINIGLEEVFGLQNSISNIAIFTNPKGRDQGFIAQAHDYTVIYAKDKTIAETNNFILQKQDLEKKFAKAKDGKPVRELPLKRTGTGKRREERPYMYFPFIYDPETKKLEVVSEEIYEQIYCRETNTFNDELLERLKRDCQRRGMVFLLPISELGEKLRWRWGYKSCITGVETGILFAKELKNGGHAIYQYDSADDEVTPKSMWIGERYDASSKGTNLLANILPNNPFDFPKSIYTVEDCIIIGSIVNRLRS